jgi:hypothetical protein
MVSRSPPRVQNSSVLTGWQEVIFTIMIARGHTPLLEGSADGRNFRAAGIKGNPSRCGLSFLFLPDTLRFPTLCALPLYGAAHVSRSKQEQVFYGRREFNPLFRLVGNDAVNS